MPQSQHRDDAECPEQLHEACQVTPKVHTKCIECRVQGDVAEYAE